MLIYLTQVVTIHLLSVEFTDEQNIFTQCALYTPGWQLGWQTAPIRLGLREFLGHRTFSANTLGRPSTLLTTGHSSSSAWASRISRALLWLHAPDKAGQSGVQSRPHTLFNPHDTLDKMNAVTVQIADEGRDTHRLNLTQGHTPGAMAQGTAVSLRPRRSNVQIGEKEQR